MITSSPLILSLPQPLPAGETCAALLERLCAPLAAEMGCATAELVDAALEREAQESTYLGRGLAVPHARMAGLRSAGLCLAATEPGTLWQGEPAEMVALVAVPDTAPELYLQTVSALLRRYTQLRKSGQLSPAALTEALHTL